MRAQTQRPNSNLKNRQARGFSLIELLIVVAIILIIAAIAIPNFIRSKITANETSAVENLRNIDHRSTWSIAPLINVGFAGLTRQFA